MRKATWIAVVMCLLGAAAIAATVSFAQDQAETRADWSKLKLVTYPSGLTGFFDPDTGRLYIYSSDLQRCVIIRQLTALGEPLKKVKL